MTENPVFIVLTLVAAGYIFNIWRQDYRAFSPGKEVGNPLPGASPVTLSWAVIGAVGALVIVGIETAGEIALGVSGDQSTVVVISLIPFICAGFMEELIFRGFAFYDKKGPKILWLSIIGASLLFALAHFQYYTEPVDGGSWWEKTLKIDPQSSWSLLILFVNSIWFYILRFAPTNTHRSLIPCFAAHIASNVGVFIVKLAQGHVTGWL